MWFFGWKLKTYIKDRYLEVRDIPDRRERRLHLLDLIDDGGFQKLVVFNGWVGFLAGAYQIFAMALTLPIIKLAYYSPLAISSGQETLLRVAILLGMMVGQLAFGFMADIYGRRKLYGYELLVILLAIVGVTMSSPGLLQSMSLFRWLFVWRFIMGIGIGADYPLSATIAAEFAPSRWRARMISMVFYAQPIGYLLATLVTVFVLHSHRHSIPNDPSTLECDVSCRRSLDQCWRIIVGVGAIPVLLALYFRRTIPESAMYTTDVLNRPIDAEDDIVNLMGVNGERRYQPLANGHPLPGAPEAIPMVQVGALQAHLNAAAGQGIDNAVAPEAEQDIQPDDEEAASFGSRWRAYWISFHQHFITNRHWRTLLGVSASWLCFDTAYYALLGSSASSTAPKIWHSALAKNCMMPAPWNGANGTTSYLLTFPYVGSLSNCQAQTSGIYSWLMSTTAEVLLLVCAGALAGGLLMIFFIHKHSPKKFQATGFLALFFIFLITGVILATGSRGQAKPGASVMFVLAGIAFELGPNFTTFMLPVELFPTKHRAFAHGIAAAAGKAGASLFQVYVQYVKFNGHTFMDVDTVWLGYTILCFMPAMLVGLLFTVYMIPETRDSDGCNRSLEVLHALEPDIYVDAGRSHREIWTSSIFLPSLGRS